MIEKQTSLYQFLHALFAPGSNDTKAPGRCQYFFLTALESSSLRLLFRLLKKLNFFKKKAKPSFLFCVYMVRGAKKTEKAPHDKRRIKK